MFTIMIIKVIDMKVINCKNAEKNNKNKIYWHSLPYKVVIVTLILYMNTLINIRLNTQACLPQNSHSWTTLLYCFKFLTLSCEFPMAVTLNTDFYKTEVAPNLVWEGIFPYDVICNLLSGKKLTFQIKCLSNFLVNTNEIKSCLGNQSPVHPGDWHSTM